VTAIQFLRLFVRTAVVFFAIDLVWLGVVAAQFYQRQLETLLAPQVRWVPAAASPSRGHGPRSQV
jgi:uncharacterized membrane protein